MVYKPAFCLAALLCLAVMVVHGQSADSVASKLTNFPTRLFGRIQSKTANLNQQLQRQTQKYMQKLQQQEQQLEKKIYAIDSNSAKKLFANSRQQYAALARLLQSDTGSSHQKLSGQYQPVTDSLSTALAFLQKNPQVLSQGGSSVNTLGSGQVVAGLPSAEQAKLQASISQLQALQAKMQDASQIKAYMLQRKQQIGQYIAQHANLQSLTAKPYAKMQADMYYYSAQVRQYRDQLNSPDALEQKAMAALSRLPAFQGFMKTNSQLSSLFTMPGSTSGPQVIAGLQTRSQISGMVQSQVTANATVGGSGSSGASADLSGKVQSAQSTLNSYKSKLSQLGGGSSEIDAPNFRPNDQKTKNFIHRLQFGVDFQTTQSTYYFPAMTNLGVHLGYLLGHGNDVGVGAAMKIGWGTGFNHIAVTGQGVGLRSFFDIAIKGSFSATGGFEYNYTTPFMVYQQLRQIQYWTKSGLIGVSKTVSMKSRLLKQTKLSILWDFLSYEAVPKRTPLIFRVGYTW
jgi:hypothetical protein